MNLKIPSHLIEHVHDEANLKLLDGRTVIGFAGYSKSGKDTIGATVASALGFRRVAFGDVMKREMNSHLKESIKSDLEIRGVQIDYVDMDFLNPKTAEIKEILRPYMIWFGQEMRRINGEHYWTNRALSEIGDSQKIVMTDIRRECELDIFINKNETPAFKSMLIHVSQYGLSDEDELTRNTIRKAQELWLFGHTIFVDSRIPEQDRPEHIRRHVDELSIKFPDYFL